MTFEKEIKLSRFGWIVWVAGRRAGRDSNLDLQLRTLTVLLGYTTHAFG